MRYVIFILSVLVLAGCQTTPYDYTNLKKYKPKSILVIPPMNNSIEVDAPYTFLSTISKPLAEKGYYVFPVAVVDQFFKQNGLPTPAEMNTISLNKIKENIGADAVLYATIEEWGQKFQVFSSVTIVDVSLKLVSIHDGTVLWQGKAFAQQGSSDGGGGLGGALIGALVTQVLSSTIDNSFPTASAANYQAIHEENTGLLPGPYAQ